MFYGDPDVIERQINESRENTMTLIVPGRFNDKTFLMSDCVGTRTDKKGNKSYHYMNKLNRLISTQNETYFCHTGQEAYGHAVRVFDRQCYEKNINFDVKNTSHIEEVLDIFKYIKEHYERDGHKIEKLCRLYFIEHGSLHYYNVNNNGSLSCIQTICDRCYIEPDNATNLPIGMKGIFNDNEEIIAFCKGKIEQYQPYGIDLKNRFSYVIIDKGGTVFDSSIRNNEELVLSETGGGYDKLK